jgi:hypothetical protein
MPRAAVLLAISAGLFACGVSESAASSPSAGPAGPAKAKSTAMAEPVLIAPDAEPVPTVEEAEAAAEKAINAGNADAELQKLKDELEGG